MNRKDRIEKLKGAIDNKRRELNLTKEQSEQYRWLADMMRLRTGGADKPSQTESPEPGQSGRSSKSEVQKKFREDKEEPQQRRSEKKPRKRIDFTA